MQVQQSIQTMRLLEESPILFDPREIELETLTANTLIGLYILNQKELENDEPPDDEEATSFMDIHELMKDSSHLGESN